MMDQLLAFPKVISEPLRAWVQRAGSCVALLLLTVGFVVAFESLAEGRNSNPVGPSLVRSTVSQCAAANRYVYDEPRTMGIRGAAAEGLFDSRPAPQFLKTASQCNGYDDPVLLRVSRTSMATKSGPCRNSFIAETLVLMADGTTKRIDMAVGDKVMATDPETGKTEAHEVVALITGEGEKHLVDVKIRTKDGVGTIVATRGHPFWIDDRGVFLRADQLRSGDDLRTPEGGVVEVISIHEHAEWIKVHNFTMEGVHTYYVLAGRQPVLVHNAGNETPSERAIRIARERVATERAGGLDAANTNARANLQRAVAQADADLAAGRITNAQYDKIAGDAQRWFQQEEILAKRTFDAPKRDPFDGPSGGC